MKVFRLDRKLILRRSLLSLLALGTSVRAYMVSTESHPRDLTQIGDLAPSVKREPIPADAFVYQTDAQGHRNLYINDKRLKTFLDEWVAMARENCKTRPTISCTGVSYEDWQDAHQRDYLRQLEAFARDRPSDCVLVVNGNNAGLQGCPDGKYKQDVEDFYRHYVESDAMRLWQLQRAEYVYVKALLDGRIREAVHSWNKLSENERLESLKRLIAYAFFANEAITHGQQLPKTIVADLGDAEGGDAMVKTIDGQVEGARIRINKKSLSAQGADESYSTAAHEGAHIIRKFMQAMMKESANSSDSPDQKSSTNTKINVRGYLRDSGLLTDVQISNANENLYSNSEQMTNIIGNPFFDSYAKQSVEAAVRVDEAMAKALVKAVLGQPASHEWTITEAQESFRKSLPNTELFDTNGPYANLDALAYKLRYEDALHGAFLKTYQGGGQVCYGEPPTRSFWLQKVSVTLATCTTL